MDLTSKVILCRPVIGCSIDCPFCYAKRENEKYQWSEDFKKIKLMDDYIEQLTQYNEAVYMVTGYSDLSEWSEEIVKKIFKICADHPQNQYLFLTKRPYDINFGCTLDNVHLGVSVCKREDKSRIDTLLKLNFQHKYVAFEPLLEYLGNVDLEGIEWISIGRELGDREDKVIPEDMWIRNLYLHAVGKRILMKSSLKEIVPDIFTQQLPDVLQNCIDSTRTSQAYLNVLENNKK